MQTIVRLPQQDEDNFHKVICIPIAGRSRSGLDRTFAARKSRRPAVGMIAPIVVLSGMVFACVARAADRAPAAPAEADQNIGQNVVMLLRDGNIEQALKALEAVSDVRHAQRSSQRRRIFISRCGTS